MASLSLNTTAKAVLLALLSAGVLTACGGGGGSTTRTDNTDNGGTTTPETTYKLTISSAVPLKNVDVKILTLGNKEIAKGSISDGSSISFDIKKSDTGQLVIAQISPQGSASSYYDPALDKSATFNTTLHRVFSSIATNLAVDVGPFSEIAYQRELVRAGSMDLSNPDPSSISVTDVRNSEDEVFATFRVLMSSDTPTLQTDFTTISKRDDYAKLTYTVGQETPVSTQQQYANAFFAAGHYMLQRNENASDTTPYLTFTKRAAEDMRDGSLDGLTIIGDGTDGSTNSYTLKNAIVGPAPLNTNPAFNKVVIYNATKPEEDLSNTNTMKGVQRIVRENYAGRWATNLHAFMNSLSKNDTIGKKGFDAFNFNEGLGMYDGLFTTLNFGLHSFGAGNYKRAFGIEPVKIAKDTQQYIRNQNCELVYTPSAPATEDTTVIPGCIAGINADGESATTPYNAIQALVGKYTSTDSCKLSITNTGIITLSKGNQTYNKSLVNRSDFSALINVGTEADPVYVLNVATASATPVEFLQLKIINQKLVSATIASSNLQYPKTLDNPSLSCNFQSGG